MGAEVATPDEAREILALAAARMSVHGRAGRAPTEVRTVACVGAGVIGGGWVAYFLARGFAVRAWDPAPDAEPRLRAIVDAAWPALTELGLADGRVVDNLTVEPPSWRRPSATPTTCRRAPRSSWTLKRRLLADIDAATPEHVVIALVHLRVRDDRDGGRRRGRAHRLVVAHPFNPPYLIPLVEVVGGEKTAADVVGVDRASSSGTSASR